MKQRRAYRYSYEDVAEIVEKNPAAVRKQMSRTCGALDREDAVGSLKKVLKYVKSCGEADVEKE